MTTEAARRRALGLLAALTLLAGAAWLAWRWLAPAGPPHLPLDGVDPEVAAAVREAEAATRQRPQSPEAWGRLGMTLLANKLEAEAVAPLARAEALDSADPRWPYLRGVALLSKDPDAALPCLRRAAERCDDGRRAAARLRLAEALAANGHEQEAEEQFRQVPAGPLSACAEYGLGALAVARGDLEAGKRHLLRCAGSPLTRHRAAAQLAVVARRLGEPPPRTGGEADPTWPDPFVTECLSLLVGKERQLQRAAALEQQGQVARALEVLREVARDYPEASSFLTLGITLGRRGHHAESEAVLRRCLELEPTLVRAQYYLSLALFGQAEALKQQGKATDAAARYEEAARWARRATDLVPGHGEAHFQLGLTLWCLDRKADAATAFRRAIDSRPDLADAHLWLGRVLAEQGQKDEAAVHLRNAARYAAPDDPRPRRALEELLGKGGG